MPKYSETNNFASYINGTKKPDVEFLREDKKFLSFQSTSNHKGTLVVPFVKAVDFGDFIDKASNKEIYDYFAGLSKVVDCEAHKVQNIINPRFVINSGKNGAQAVYHLHSHIKQVQDEDKNNHGGEPEVFVKHATNGEKNCFVSKFQATDGLSQYLVVPDKKYQSFDDFINSGELEVAKFFKALNDVIKQSSGLKEGYRITFDRNSNYKDGSNSPYPFCVHIAGGKELGYDKSKDEAKYRQFLPFQEVMCGLNQVMEVEKDDLKSRKETPIIQTTNIETNATQALKTSNQTKAETSLNKPITPTSINIEVNSQEIKTTEVASKKNTKDKVIINPIPKTQNQTKAKTPTISDNNPQTNRIPTSKIQDQPKTPIPVINEVNSQLNTEARVITTSTPEAQNQPQTTTNNISTSINSKVSLEKNGLTSSSSNILIKDNPVKKPEINVENQIRETIILLEKKGSIELPATQKSDTFADIVKNLENENRFTRHVKSEIDEGTKKLIELEDNKKDKVFNNKLVRSINNLRKAKEEGKTSAKDIWKNSLTTLDRRVLVDFYNANSGNDKINFISLYKDREDNQKSELRINNQDYVLNEDKLGEITNILKYSAKFIPSNSVSQSHADRVSNKSFHI